MIQKFIKKCSKLNDPVGDLANDMLNDSNFPQKGTKEDIFMYMECVNKCKEAQQAWKYFKKKYNK